MNMRWYGSGFEQFETALALLQFFLLFGILCVSFTVRGSNDM